MSRNIVISQSMYFPWVGLLEQIRLADVFVHYDDVQYSKGSFSNRVQVKGVDGVGWMTLPLRDYHLGQRIDEVLLNDRTDWRGKHREMLRQAYRKAPFRDEMLGVVDRVFSENVETVADISRRSMLELSRYFGLDRPTFLSSQTLPISGASSERVCNIVEYLEGNVYITGHGARAYLNHGLFEERGISVEYMHYQRTPYPQLHGVFTPYVTALDLVANCGSQGAAMIHSGTVGWKEFTQ
ncbi:WbqC family protein [Pararhizobium sp. YC-54]|uniref:WbqC family protein n=1 Tax=Pararhizobium sp. YC-54 TaxID=2986920 RepID=UPI0021F6F212|nr:WbqC family protein [Pararhizobium sp. YC-54]MCV9998884.1 WbqC family protein [Pararhizobium sp. YC-54]